MTSKAPKQIKLQSKHRGSVYGNKTVPWLNVGGVWLEALGFSAGDTVRILTREKLLIIELVEDQNLLEEGQSKKDLQAIKKQLKNLIK